VFHGVLQGGYKGHKKDLVTILYYKFNMLYVSFVTVTNSPYKTTCPVTQNHYLNDVSLVSLGLTQRC